MSGFRRAVVKVLVLVPLALFAAALAIGPGGLISYTPATRLGVHSMIAFWISIPAALSVLSYQKRQRRANVLIMAALFFPMIVHIGSAVRNLLRLSELVIIRTQTDLLADTFEMAIFAVLLVSAVICAAKSLSPFDERIPNFVVFTITILLPFILFGTLWMLANTVLNAEQVMILGWILACIALVSFSATLLLSLKFRVGDIPIDIGYMTSSILLFSSSLVVLLIPLPLVGWEFAETLQMAAYLLLALAVGVPFLRRAGYRRRFAYGIVIGLILMAYFPFLITIIIETSSLNIIIFPDNLLAYSIIHIGGASLAIMMATLLYIYPKKKTSWSHYPLILIFGMWAGITLFLVVSFLVPSLFPFGEPITPITVGSLLTLVLLRYAIKWTRYPPQDDAIPPSLPQLLLVLFGLISAVVIGEMINQAVLLQNPSMVDDRTGSILILSSNLFIMFTFAFMVFLLAVESKGESPIELYVMFFLVIWILPNILKSYYFTWYAGWWVSEILLFAGLLAGPPVLIWLYVRSMHEVEDSHRRANMYADLLMHDVSNYNQMMMMSLELLGTHDISKEQRSRLADDGRQVISFSEQLISNVRLLSEANQLQTSQLQPTNLVETIVGALDIFVRRIGSGELVVDFQPKDSNAYVMANDLLVHVFLNILYSALECRIRGETVTIGIHETAYSSTNYWQIDIKAPGRSDNQEDGYSSGTLGLLAARLMTESLDGYFAMETFARTDICDGRLFTIRLRATNE